MQQMPLDLCVLKNHVTKYSVYSSPFLLPSHLFSKYVKLTRQHASMFHLSNSFSSPQSAIFKCNMGTRALPLHIHSYAIPLKLCNILSFIYVFRIKSDFLNMAHSTFSIRPVCLLKVMYRHSTFFAGSICDYSELINILYFMLWQTLGSHILFPWCTVSSIRTGTRYLSKPMYHSACHTLSTSEYLLSERISA